MIILLRKNAQEKQIQKLVTWLEKKQLHVQTIKGAETTVMGLIGDTSEIDMTSLYTFDIVEDVKRISEPYKRANRKFHPEDTVVSIGDTKIGGGNFAVIAGPCSVESIEQICSIAHSVKSSGATMLRGGAFKPRTSPYAFQGLRADGITMMLEARKQTGLPIVTEIMDLSQLHLFDEVDVIQVGARNMQNFELLKKLGKTKKPILLKRGLANTLEEFLMSAEYILAGGNTNVILCERGIRTFETATRNTLDLAAIPLLKETTHLPVIVDPSHATGLSKLVKPMALAAAVCGADGLIIEVHNNPAKALCDGQQSITPSAFDDVIESVRKVLPYSYK